MQLNEEQIRQIFCNIKQKSHEYANLDEFHGCIRKLYPTMSDGLFLQLFRILDTNNNERIDFDEFKRFIKIIIKIPYEDDADLYFALADTN